MLGLRGAEKRGALGHAIATPARLPPRYQGLLRQSAEAEGCSEDLTGKSYVLEASLGFGRLAQQALVTWRKTFWHSDGVTEGSALFSAAQPPPRQAPLSMFGVSEVPRH